MTAAQLQAEAHQRISLGAPVQSNRKKSGMYLTDNRSHTVQKKTDHSAQQETTPVVQRKELPTTVTRNSDSSGAPIQFALGDIWSGMQRGAVAGAGMLSYPGRAIVNASQNSGMLGSTAGLIGGGLLAAAGGLVGGVLGGLTGAVAGGVAGYGRQTAAPAIAAPSLIASYTYAQDTDPSVTPFLGRTGRRFMGERGARQQLRGITPSDDHVREDAYTHSSLRHGSGLHEIVPTDMRGEVASSHNPVLVGLQSGFRTSTAEQLFRRDLHAGERSRTASISREVGAHTAFAPNPSGRGSTHTRGQAAGHDQLRQVVRRDLVAERDPATAVNTLALAHFAVTPHGQDVLESNYVTGMDPNLSAIGRIGVAGDASHIALAAHVHEHREHVKRRARGLKRRTGRGRSPSPTRTPIDAHGRGGGYGPHPAGDVEAVPAFAGADDFETTADMAAWVSQPQRL
jgi:hypothetical protein